MPARRLITSKRVLEDQCAGLISLQHSQVEVTTTAGNDGRRSTKNGEKVYGIIKKTNFCVKPCMNSAIGRVVVIVALNVHAETLSFSWTDISGMVETRSPDREYYDVL